VIALTRNKPDTETNAGRSVRRQQLLDELVEIEKAGKTETSEKRREQIMAELETLWDDAA
jgi:hypothetical protein